MLLLAITLNGCLKDSIVESFTFYRPVYRTKAEVRANIKSNTPQSLKQPGKLYIRGNYIFLNDINRGIHVIDYSNPASPKNIGFIAIPGNADLAVKGNYLYADHYTDLVTLDISNPQNVTAVKFNNGVFPENVYTADTGKIVVEWIRVDTTVRRSEKYNLEKDLMASGALFGSAVNNSSPGGSAGKGGSMARFTLLNDRLYTVSHTDLKVFNTTVANDPQYVKKIGLNAWDIETIYPFQNKLFIGSQSGMYIYSVSNPDNPSAAGQFVHARSCDPVIADGNYAYVTLRSGTTCQGFTNQLEVVNISNLSAPSLVKTYPFTNPRGLSKDGNYLFICDGTDGLKVLNASDAANITSVKTIGGMETYDVIAFNNIAITVAKDGLYLVDYTNAADIKIISKITVSK